MKNTFRLGEEEAAHVHLIVSTTEPGVVLFTVSKVKFNGGIESSSLHNVTYGTTTLVSFPADSVYVSGSEQRDRALQIQAEEGKTISVYGVGDRFHPSDGFVALSCDGMTVENFNRYDYIILSAGQQPTFPQARSEFLIIPCEDNTTITISPPHTVTVNATDLLTTQFGIGSDSVSAMWQDMSRANPRAGETLLISSLEDLTGTHIRGDKPLIVFSGHQCGSISPPTAAGACNYLVEQIPPHTTWGSTFFLSPLALRESGNYYRIATVYNDTEVNVTCVDEGSHATESMQLSLGKLQGENWNEYQTQSPNEPPDCADPFVQRFCSLQASNPVVVAQYSHSYTVDFSCRNSDIGGGFMAIVPPVSQYLNYYTFSTIEGESATTPTYISVSVHAAFFSPSDILLDDVPLESEMDAWQAFISSDGRTLGYGLRKKVRDGYHRISHTTSNAGIGVQIYGYSQKNSYGYSAGMELQAVSGE